MSRPTKDAYFLKMAALVATRATCLRRSVGCVLVNARGHVLATGYNGVAAGLPHCNEKTITRVDPSRYYKSEYLHACLGAGAAAGDALEQCAAIHAEQNALLQCRDVWAIDTCYATVFPCVHCAKLLLNTGCRRIVHAADYADASQALWVGAGRAAEKLVII